MGFNSAFKGLNMILGPSYKVLNKRTVIFESYR